MLYPLPYRAARSFTRNPIFRFLGVGGAMSSRMASNTVSVCLPKTDTILRRPCPGKFQQIKLSFKFGGHPWMELATTAALAFQGEPKLFGRIKLSHKLLSTPLLWRKIVIGVHDRMPV